MSRLVKRILLGAIASLTLAVGSATATAAEALVSPAGAITATSAGNITFSGGEISVECAVTLNGTLARSFPVVEGATEGSITAGRSAGCSGGGIVEFLLPTALKLKELLGPAGERTGILLILEGFGVRIRILGIECLYEFRFELLAALIRIPGSRPPAYDVETSKRLLRINGRRVRGSIFCPGSIEARGAFNTSPSQTLTELP